MWAEEAAKVGEGKRLAGHGRELSVADAERSNLCAQLGSRSRAIRRGRIHDCAVVAVARALREDAELRADNEKRVGERHAYRLARAPDDVGL